MPRKEYINVDDFSAGQLSDKTSERGSGFAFAQGVDILSDPGVLRVSQKMVEDASFPALTPPAPIVSMVHGYNNDVWGKDSADNIYLREDGIWTLQHTDANGEFDSDVEEYDGAVYWASKTNVGKHNAGSIVWDDSWNTITNSGSTRILKRFQNKLLIGHGRYISSWNDTVFVNEALRLPVGTEITAIVEFGDFAAIATRSIVDKKELRSSSNTQSQDGSGNKSWTTMDRVATSDDQYASVQIDPAEISSRMFVKDFGFSIPADAEILGVEVNIERSRSGLSVGQIEDEQIQLTINGTTMTGNNYATTGDWTATESTVKYGGKSDLWGIPLTVTNVNAATFGVGIAVENIDGANSGVALVDHVWMTLYYRDSSGSKASSNVFFWNGLPTASAETQIEISERSISALAVKDNILFAIGGDAGNLYFYNNARLIQIKRYPHVTSSTTSDNAFQVTRNSFIPRGRLMLIGGGHATSDLTKAVWAFGAVNPETQSMSLSAMNVSSRGTLDNSIAKIHALIDFGGDLMMSYEDESGTKRVDVEDRTGRIIDNVAQYQTPIHSVGEASAEKQWWGFRLRALDVPANNTIELSYRINVEDKSDAWIVIDTIDDTNFRDWFYLNNIMAKNIQFRMRFDVPAADNTTPILLGYDIMYTPRSTRINFS